MMGRLLLKLVKWYVRHYWKFHPFHYRRLKKKVAKSLNGRN